MIATVSRAVGARGETARRRDARKRRSGSKAVRALASGPMAPNEEVVEFFKRAEAVAFDVDSTVCEDEGIDELAEFAGAGEAVAAITKQAMEGGMPFGEALQLRLEAMKVSRQQVEEYVRTHPPKYSPGIKELMAALKASGKEVYLVSGGFRQMIAPIAEGLGIRVITSRRTVWCSKKTARSGATTHESSLPLPAARRTQCSTLKPRKGTKRW